MKVPNRTKIKSFDFKEYILDSLKLYSLTLSIPIVMTVMVTLMAIVGVDLIYGLLETYRMLWIDYYFTGHLGGLDAWRIHIAVFIICLMVIGLGKIED